VLKRKAARSKCHQLWEILYCRREENCVQPSRQPPADMQPSNQMKLKRSGPLITAVSSPENFPPFWSPRAALLRASFLFHLCVHSSVPSVDHKSREWMSESSKKRKSDLPDSASINADEIAQSSGSSQPESIFDAGGESEWRYQLAAMRTRLDESQTELAASQAENERLRAAALAPCPRCSHYAGWSVRVRTMVGQVHTIACPDGPATLIVHVKKELAPLNPKWIIQEQLTLVLPCEASSSSSDSDPMDPALADDKTLASCGVSKGDLLELLLVDMEWSAHSRAIIEQIKHGGEGITFSRDTPIRDEDGSLALSWALVNAVCSSIYF
jgi:hypothetical protein